MKVGIALGGGGAKGFAHIGVLEALSEAGIECEVVTGTSAGSIVGASYCCGTLAKLKQKACGMSLKDIPPLFSPAWNMQGLSSGESAVEFLTETLTCATIEELSKRFGAVACDLKSAELVELTSGSLKNAIRSSISIPGLFTPVTLDGRLLVDGGIADAIPIELARKLGAEFVIGVDLFQSQEPSTVDLIPSNDGFQSALRYAAEKVFGAKSDRVHLIRVLELSFAAIAKQITALRSRVHPADFIIGPRVSAVGVLDFHRAAPIIQIGRIAAEEALPALRASIPDSYGNRI